MYLSQFNLLADVSILFTYLFEKQQKELKATNTAVEYKH